MTIFQAPFAWIKAWNKIRGKLKPDIVANVRGDFEKWSAYKIQLQL